MATRSWSAAPLAAAQPKQKWTRRSERSKRQKPKPQIPNPEKISKENFIGELDREHLFLSDWLLPRVGFGHSNVAVPLTPSFVKELRRAGQPPPQGEGALLRICRRL